MNFNRYYFILIFSVFHFFQTEISLSSGKNDSTEIKLPSVLSFSADYSGNTNTFGRFNSFVSQPNYSFSAGYFGKKGLITNVSGIITGNSDSTNSKPTYETDLMIGYNFKFLKHFSFTPSYTRFFYGKNNTALISAYNQYLQASIAFNNKWISCTLTGGHTFGDYKEPILQLSMGIPLIFNNTFFKNHSLMIQPTFDVSMGNQDYYNTFVYNNLRFLLGYTYLYPHADFSDFYDFVSRGEGGLLDIYDNYLRFYPNYPESTFNSFLTFLDSKYPDRTNIIDYRALARYRIINDRNVYNWLINQYNNKPGMEIIDIFKSEKEFNFNSIGFVLPIYYSISNFTLNLSASAYKPINTPDYLDSNWIFYFSAGLSYDLFLKK